MAKGFQVLTAPINIPDVIPEIDLSKKLTNEADFSGRGVAGGIAAGVVGGTAPVVSDQPYFDFQVEKPVAPVPGTGSPRYPDILRSASVEGEVLAQFVVDTTGRVEVATFKVIRKSHDLFEAAVRSALPNMRFLPAEVGGRKVKQLVQQPFVFALQK
jgi:protein TonB